MYVYLIRNNLTGKGYVGLTRQKINDRLRAHRKNAKSESRHRQAISKAIYKYGWKAFSPFVLEVCQSVEELSAAETQWIERLGTMAPNGYNLRPGGVSEFAFSDESKVKMSVAAKERWARGTSPTHTGCKRSEETKQRMRDAWKERRLSGKPTVARKGHPMSDKNKEALRAVHTGRVPSEETRKRMSDAQFARTRASDQAST